MEELRSRGATGTVTTYKSGEGYGFLSTLDVKDDEIIDVFFHISDVGAGSVEEGWRFRFDVYSTRKGFHADNIEIISKKSSKDDESTVDERFLRRRNSEVDDTKHGVRSNKKRKKDDEEKEEEVEEENESPFKDDITGSKNDLL